MLCLSGFELYSRWVPLTYYHFVAPSIKSESKTILHSGFHSVYYGFQAFQSFSVESNRQWESGFLGLHVFLIPKLRIPGSTSKYFPDYWMIAWMISAQYRVRIPPSRKGICRRF